MQQPAKLGGRPLRKLLPPNRVGSENKIQLTMAETSFDDDECREIAAIKIQAIARGMQTRTILHSNDIQTAKVALAARYEERSASLATVRKRSSGNNMNDSKVLAVRASI
jgi:hypothetical protein